MNLIDQACRAAVRREFNIPSAPGNCLAATRVITEYGLAWPDRALYDRVVTYKASWNQGTNDRYAADAEESFRQRGWVATDDPRPGDWLFSHIPDPQYHVAPVFRGEDGALYLLENTAYERGTVLYGAVRVTPLEQWDRPITLIGRFPPELVERPDPAPPVPVAPPAPAPGKVRVFNAATNRLVTTTTLIGDKVYVKPEFLDPRYR